LAESVAFFKANAAFAITHHYERGEAETTATFHHFCYTIYRNQAVDHVAFLASGTLFTTGTSHILFPS
jgi:hypothetical protein